MLEAIGLTSMSLGEELLLGGSFLALDVALPELILMESVAIAAFLIFKAIKKRKQERDSQQIEQPGTNPDINDEPEAPDINDDDQQQVDQEIDEELKQENDIRDSAQLEEQKQEVDLLIDRERRLDHLREEIGVDQTPDELLLYPPGVRDEIREYERQQQEYNRRHPDGGPGGDGGDDPGGDGDDPDGPNWDDIYNPYNNNNNRDIRANESPFQKMLKEAATKLAGDFATRLTQQKEDEKEHDEGKIDDKEFESRQQQNDIIMNQLESQKQMLDIMHMMSVNELTDEQSLVELEKIDQDIQKMTQQQVKVGDVFANDIVTF